MSWYWGFSSVRLYFMLIHFDMTAFEATAPRKITQMISTEAPLIFPDILMERKETVAAAYAIFCQNFVRLIPPFSS